MRIPGMYGGIKIIAGSNSVELSEKIANYLTHKAGISSSVLVEREIYKFPNDNTFVQLGESTRGQDVYIVQSMGRPVNDNIMELLITLDAVRRDSAARITAVIPYMAYTRTDKRDVPRSPITARLLADMIEVAGADRYITIDLHTGQIQGFFHIPGDALSAAFLMIDYVKALDLGDIVVTTTDLGFAKDGRDWGRALKAPVAFVEKKRNGTEVSAMNIIGDVEGKNVLLVDDEVDTGGSLVKAVNLLDQAGVKEITVAFTHAVFSDPIYDRVAVLEKRVREFIFTDTIPVPKDKMRDSFTVISVADMIGEVMRRAHQGISVGAMFNKDWR